MRFVGRVGPFTLALAIGQRWCYSEWRALLDAPNLERALAVLRRYPRSGAAEALERGGE